MYVSDFFIQCILKTLLHIMHMSVQGELSPEDPLPLHMGKYFAQALLTEGKSLWFLPAHPLFTREVTRAVEKKKSFYQN
jgi:hypothetical protein